MAINNGDFSTSSYSAWSIASFTNGTTKPYSVTADGDTDNYDGTDNGGKTGGAKWTDVTKASPRTTASRFAYQPQTLDSNASYTLEYSYAINSGGGASDKVVVEILPGHYSEGETAISATPITQLSGSSTLGKNNFTTISQSFTSPSNGSASIWMYSEATANAYIDNVKLTKD